jgi:nucleoside-diphosphate-sugar epimerase
MTLWGDVLDYASVEAAARGQQAVLSALGHKRYFWPTRILSEGTRNLLRAMDSHGVRRFVCETSLGIGDSAGKPGLLYTLFVVPVILPFYFWDKARQEKLIAKSCLEWVMVRPGALTNGKPRGRWRPGRRSGQSLLDSSDRARRHRLLHAEPVDGERERGPRSRGELVRGCGKSRRRTKRGSR